MSAVIRTDVSSRDLADTILAPVRHALRDLENTLGLEAVDEQGDMYGIESAEASAGTRSQLVEAGQQRQRPATRQALQQNSGNDASVTAETAEVSRPAPVAETAEVSRPAPMAETAETAEVSRPAPVTETAEVSRPAPTSAVDTIPARTARTRSEPQHTSLSREHPTIPGSTGQKSSAGYVWPAVAATRAHTDSTADASATRVAARPRQHAMDSMERPTTIVVRRSRSATPTASVSATDALLLSHKTPPRAGESVHPRAESAPAMNQTPALHAQSVPAPAAVSRPGPGGIDREHLEQTLAEILREAARRDGVDVP